MCDTTKRELTEQQKAEVMEKIYALMDQHFPEAKEAVDRNVLLLELLRRIEQRQDLGEAMPIFLEDLRKRRHG